MKEASLWPSFRRRLGSFGPLISLSFRGCAILPNCRYCAIRRLARRVSSGLAKNGRYCDCAKYPMLGLNPCFRPAEQ
jgi:hypothetical protein